MLDWTAIWPFFRYQSINRRLSVSSRCAEVLKTKNISQRLRLRRSSKIWAVSWQLTWEDMTNFTSSSVNANGKTSILLKFFFRYGSTIFASACVMFVSNMVTRWRLKALKKGFMKWKLKFILCSNRGFKLKTKHL